MNVQIKLPYGSMKFDLSSMAVMKLLEYAMEAQQERLTPPDLGPQPQRERLYPSWMKQTGGIKPEAPEKKAKPERHEADPDDEPESEPEPEPKFEPEPEEPEPDEAETVPEERDGWTGFLLIQCQRCGKQKEFCTKKPLRYYRCPDCKEKTWLGELKPLGVRCECGTRAGYKTNLKDHFVELTCVNCQAPVSAEWNEKKQRYNPI